MLPLYFYFENMTAEAGHEQRAKEKNENKILEDKGCAVVSEENYVGISS